MKLNNILITSMFAIILSAPAVAENMGKNELAEPIVKLMPHIKAVRDELKLTAEQSSTIDSWLAEAPKKRKTLEQEVLNIRSELRVSLLNREGRMKREELKTRLSAANTRLIEMSSLCARMLHNTLTKAQYAKVVKHYQDAK
jgi:predicted transcriptional regulator